MPLLYYVGRVLQLLSLLTMPSAIWIAHFERNEAAAIVVFVGSLITFWIGVLLARSGKVG